MGYYYRGFANFYSMKNPYAIDDFTTYLLSNPDDWKTIFYRALCFKSLSKKEEFTIDFIKAMELNPQLPN